MPRASNPGSAGAGVAGGVGRAARRAGWSGSRGGWLRADTKLREGFAVNLLLQSHIDDVVDAEYLIVACTL